MQDMSDLDVANFWTQAKGEPEIVRSFALIPEGWENKLDQHPLDDSIFYWCDKDEWLALGAGERLGDVDVICCACDECERDRAEN